MTNPQSSHLSILNWNTRFILLFVLLVISNLIQAQNENHQILKAKFKSLFIYNFTKYTEWPEGSIGSEFKIGVVGDSILHQQLKLASERKKIDNKTVQVSYFNDLSKASECQLLYVNADTKISATKLFQAIGASPVLLVTEGYSYNSTMINFVEIGKRLQFQLNSEKAEAQGLIIDPKLDDLASKVKSEKDWNALLKETQNELEEERNRTRVLATSNYELNAQVANLKEDLKLLHSQKQDLMENIDFQSAELEDIYDHIGVQKDVYQSLLSDLKAKEEEIEQKELELKYSSDKLSENLLQLEQTAQRNEEMEGEMNLMIRLLHHQKVIIYLIIFVAIIIATLGLIAFNNFKKQREQSRIIAKQKNEVESSRDEIKLQHEQLEEKNREITDSIQYAKRIQTAILPPQRIVKEYLVNSFILYKPKDVVAGDFYWLETVGDNVYFAAADCTGHGVPGAMVSVICNNGLNRSVREFGLRKPSEILDKTRELVIQEFEKSEEEVKDGMDISLCALNTKTNELQWSGANNPLWVVTSRQLSDFSNEADDRRLAVEGLHLYEVKADKQPIGKYGVAQPFTNHELKLSVGDTIYLSSDGYPDQFGGENGKKYKSGNFKKTLLRLASMPMDEQKTQLDQEFETWRGPIEQVDDVCVIGVRI